MWIWVISDLHVHVPVPQAEDRVRRCVDSRLMNHRSRLCRKQHSGPRTCDTFSYSVGTASMTAYFSLHLGQVTSSMCRVSFLRGRRFPHTEKPIDMTVK